MISGGLAPMYGTNAKFKLCTKLGTQKNRERKKWYALTTLCAVKIWLLSLYTFSFFPHFSQFFPRLHQALPEIRKTEQNFTLIPKKNKSPLSPTPGPIFPRSTWRPLRLLISFNCCLVAFFTFSNAGWNFGKVTLESCISQTKLYF